MKAHGVWVALVGLALMSGAGCGDSSSSADSTVDVRADTASRETSSADTTIDAPPPDIGVDTAPDSTDAAVDAPADGAADSTVDALAADSTVDAPATDTTVDAAATDTTVDAPAADTTVDTTPPPDATVDSGSDADAGRACTPLNTGSGLAAGQTCSGPGDCASGLNCIASSCAAAAASCAAIKTAWAAAPDGLYWLTSSTTPVRVYCDMTLQVVLCSEVQGAHDGTTREGSSLNYTMVSVLLPQSCTCEIWALRGKADNYPLDSLSASAGATLSTCEALGLIADATHDFCPYGGGSGHSNCGYAVTPLHRYGNHCTGCQLNNGNFANYVPQGPMNISSILSDFSGTARARCFVQ